jgi:hypothetical protein
MLSHASNFTEEAVQCGRDSFISTDINLFSMKKPKDRSRLLRRVAEVKVRRMVEVDLESGRSEDLDW